MVKVGMFVLMMSLINTCVSEFLFSSGFSGAWKVRNDVVSERVPTAICIANQQKTVGPKFGDILTCTEALVEVGAYSSHGSITEHHSRSPHAVTLVRQKMEPV